MRSKLSLIMMLGLLTIPAIARADSLSVGQIAQELKQDAVIPLAPSVGNQLAKNLHKQARHTRSSNRTRFS